MLQCHNDVELAAGEIRALANDREWETARETYAEVREALDMLITAVHWTEPIDTETLAPEVTTLERTLEEAHARLYLERSRSQLELGTYLIENEDYDQARKVMEQTQQYYERALVQREAVRRGDAFQFGTQRALDEAIERLGWEIETAAAEPIRQAHESKIRAKTADTAERALECWERAFRRYGLVLTLEWGDDERYFAGDHEDVRANLAEAGVRLIELRAALSHEDWNEGVRAAREGNVKAALERCQAARDHLERAHELATEFAPERASTFETKLERMAESLRDLRDGDADTVATEKSNPETAGTRSKDTEYSEDAPLESTSIDDKEADASTSQEVDSSAEQSATDRLAQDAPEGGTEDENTSLPEREVPKADGDRNPDTPSLEDLSRMDTHHELTMDLEGEDPDERLVINESSEESRDMETTVEEDELADGNDQSTNESELTGK